MLFRSPEPSAPTPQDPDISPKPAAQQDPDASTEPSAEPGESDEPTDKGKARDPLRWFGILVPAALRSAQSSFISAIEEPIPHLATLTKDLRRQEADIVRLRKQLRKL